MCKLYGKVGSLWVGDAFISPWNNHYNTETHCIQTETFPPLALQSFIATIQRNWDTIVNDATVATVYILLSRLWQLHPINLSDAAKMMELCNILWRSTHNPMAVWYANTHSHADCFGISVYVFNTSLFESNNILVYDLYHQYMVFTLC